VKCEREAAEGGGPRRALGGVVPAEHAVPAPEQHTLSSSSRATLVQPGVREESEARRQRQGSRRDRAAALLLYRKQGLTLVTALGMIRE
jgi:hypothetical protein